MEARELRIGNLVYYHIKDKLDERKEWDEVSTIDAADLKILTEYESNPEYKPIPLTDEWRLKFGKIIWLYKDIFGYYFRFNNKKIRIRYVHQLQNLYFALTGKELEIK